MTKLKVHLNDKLDECRENVNVIRFSSAVVRIHADHATDFLRIRAHHPETFDVEKYFKDRR